MFVTRGARRHSDEVLLQKPVPSVRELTEAGATVVNAPDARSFSTACSTSAARFRASHPTSAGCPALKLAADGKSWEPDPFIMDERYVAVHVKGKGAVVFTACSHAA